MVRGAWQSGSFFMSKGDSVGSPVVVAAGEAAATLPRSLSLLDAIGVIVGIVIGSGIFKVTSDMMRYMGTPGMVVLIWIVAGIISFLGGVTFAELGSRYPQPGGLYIYLRESFGPLWAFLFGWSLFLVIQTGSIAAVAIVFAEHIAVLYPLSKTAVTAVGVGVIAFLSIVNACSTRTSATVQNLFSFAKCLAIGSLIAMAFTSKQATTAHFHPFFPGHTEGNFIVAIGAALVAALWAYDGWYQVGNMAGEMENPERDVPRSLFLGIGLVCLLYILVSIAYMVILTPQQVATSQRVATDTAQAVLGNRGAYLIAIAVIISTFGCINGMSLVAPRVYYMMARDGLFFEALGRPHPTFQTPFHAVLLQGLWSVVLVFYGDYDALYNYVMFITWLFYGLAAAGLFIQRKKNPSYKGYHAWGYPFTPLIFLLFCIFLMCTSVQSNPKESLIGTVIMGAGLPVYQFWSRSKRS
jgi:APA family basic amino acid/polyamine antiporter